ncbi:MAG TPA: D-isomer specific 2-hydroxyacid dehydrogenase family protein [Polyangiaceae bacterium]|nr:D-isomer specific 2-hydroxyacid dehydrogenase family protein [Polyangiaceae bacterium]
MRALLTGAGYSTADIASLTASGYDVICRESVGAAELAALLPTLDAYVLGGDERLDAKAIAQAERLRVISFVGTGYGDFIDVAAARARGIDIRNTPGIASVAVAEHAVGLLLGLVRGLFAHNQAVKNGLATPGATLELGRLEVGVVGLGNIGARVARMLRRGFGCHVRYHSRSRKPELEAELELEHQTLGALAASSDAIILLLPLSPETTNLIGRDFFARCKPGAFLVNCAGARLVDPAALKSALETGVLGAAAFDSYWVEPPPAPGDDTHGLLALPDARFVVTPHVAAKTKGSWDRMLHDAVANILGARNGVA